MSDKPACRYGASCYQTNPAHLKAYSHPTKSENNKPKKTTAQPSPKKTDTKQPASNKIEKKEDKKEKKQKTEKKEEVKEEEEDEEMLDIPDGKEVCKFGKYCFRTSKDHRNQFVHPTISVISLAN